MTSSDILSTIIKDHQFRCWQCQRTVTSATCKDFRGNTMVTFKCHGKEETVAVPVFVLPSLRHAKRCHQLLDTLIPFLGNGARDLESGQPRLCSEGSAIPALPIK